MELAASSRGHCRLMPQINKIHAVRTISLVARELGEDVEWLAEIATEMEPEDGLIWVYGPGDEDAVMAFSDDGVDNLINLVEIHRQNGD
ncbi:hypothetical protein [Sphingomonas sp. DBB INV C78]|uniref:hypothetical protein n=1 Tax=Sphingomonas sp. DBB INV C78 TaxID=3349434 RepID=UPI0036D2872C